MKIAIKSINKKINLLKRSEAMKITSETLKSVKNHNLNSDESKLKRLDKR